MNEEIQKWLDNYNEQLKNIPLVIFQPWEPTPDNPAPILSGTPKTRDFIFDLLAKLEKQEKIINAMAEDIYDSDYLYDSDDLFNHIYVDGIEGIKQYYEKKVSEGNETRKRKS